MRRTLTLAFLTLALLVAVPVALSALRDQRPRQIVPSPTAVEPSPTAAEQAQPAPAPTRTVDDDAVAGGAADVELEWGATWRRMNPRSLETPGEPLELGDPMYTAASPDGRFLASSISAIAPEGGFDSSRGRRMLLVDTQRWEIIAETPMDSGISERRYSVSGGPYLLAVTDAGTVVWVSGYRTVIWDAEQRAPETGPRLPKSFIAWDIAILAGGRVGLFGPQHAHVSPCSACPARVVVLDLERAEPLIDSALPDIELDGIHSDEGGQQVRPGLAWDAERERAYVVEGEKVVAIDLSTGEVRSAHTRAATLPERLLDWAAPTALAKSAAGVSYNAAVSPDGARLYVTGVRTEPVYDDEGQIINEQQAPLGLRVIDTASLKTVGELDLPVSDIAVAPDGRVLLTGVSDGNLVSNPAHRASGLYIIGPDLSVEHHIADEMLVWVLDFPVAGQVLVSFTGSGGHLHVIDLDSGDTVAERTDHSVSLPEGYLAGGFAAGRGHSRPVQGSADDAG